MAMHVSPLDAFGVEVTGLDACNICEPERVRLYELWLEHGLLVIRDVDQDPKVQLSLARQFGPLQEHPKASIQVNDEAELIFLGNGDGSDYLPIHRVDGELRRGFIYWHCDLAYVPEINKGAMLGLREIPATRGGTEFADTARGYDDLPEETKARIEGLEAVHVARTTPERTWGNPEMHVSYASPAEAEAVTHDTEFPPVIQPLVITHGETGRKSLMLSPLTFEKILGLPTAEGEALFEDLVRHVLQPQYRYRHQWRKGDMVLWDNRRTIHSAQGYPPDQTRMAIRATLAERQPTGRYYVT